MNRKTFLQMLAAASVASAAGDRVRTGIIGSGSRGQYLMGDFKEVGAELTAVCDVYEPNLREGLKIAPGGKVYGDYRKMLEDKSIEAVIIATPDHWHCPMAIDAVEAGKDVYLEKPVAHNIDEGFRLIDAVRRTRCVLQVGTQRRSFDLFIEARKIMESGVTGEVKLVNAWWLNTTPKTLSSPPLEGELDWQRWLGPAPRREMDPRRFFHWQWFFEYGGGYLASQAAHIVDAINWMMGSTYPLAVTSSGRVDQQGAELPETASMSVEYANYMAVFTLGYKSMSYAFFGDQMKQFHGSKARFDLGREAFALYPENPKAMDLKPSVEKRMPSRFNASTAVHIRNFLDCVRTRKDPNAKVEDGVAASVAICMAIESYRQGRRIRFDAASRSIA
jgi:predicted dehydrogenase